MEFHPRKIFTVEAARNTLPFVKKVVADILDQSYESPIMASILGKDAHNHQPREGSRVDHQALSKRLGTNMDLS